MVDCNQLPVPSKKRNKITIMEQKKNGKQLTKQHLQRLIKKEKFQFKKLHQLKKYILLIY
jgi:hypothetical protein